MVVLLLLCSMTAVSQTNTAPRPIELVAEGQERLIDGRERFDEEALRRAIDLSRRALEVNPRYADAHMILAEAYTWLDELDTARVHIEAAERLGYRGADLSILAGRIAVLSGSFDEARDMYQRVLTEEPYNESARVGVSLLGLIDGTTAIERRELDRLEARYPQNRQLLIALIELSDRAGDDDAVGRYLDLALRFHGESASVQFIAAEKALRAGSLEDATRYGRNAVTIAPDFKDAWLLLAEIARRRGDVTAARAHYESLIRLEPENHRAWYARGILLQNLDQPEMAIQSWERSRSIRPDYELASLAIEHDAIDRLAMESERRKELAEPYLSIGASLEDRFLFRQAEQAYRRGLRISPFHNELRRALAEMYRSRGMNGRFLQELEVIEELGGGSRNLSDLIEVFRDVRRDAVAVEWGVDQFVAPRPLTRILLTYATSPGTIDPDAGDHVTRYLQSLLNSSQNIDAVRPRNVPATSPVQIASAGRAVQADTVVALSIDLEDRRVVISYRMYRSDAVVPFSEGTIVRSGNDRIRNAVRDLSVRIEDTVTPQGFVLDRSFEEVLVGLGSVDGLEIGDEIAFYSTPGGDELGTAAVTALDDLLSVVRWQPSSSDDLGVGDRAVYVGPPEENGTDEEENGRPEANEDRSIEGGVLPEGNSPAYDLVQQVFQVR